MKLTFTRYKNVVSTDPEFAEVKVEYVVFDYGAHSLAEAVSMAVALQGAVGFPLSLAEQAKRNGVAYDPEALLVAVLDGIKAGAQARSLQKVMP